MRYIAKEQASIGKMLLLTAFSRFFVMGITIVGLPFLIRTVLGFDAKYYGAAESALAVATIFAVCRQSSAFFPFLPFLSYSRKRQTT